MSAPVLVIGATGGIGAAIARNLAARDVPLVLTGRDAERLRAIGDETAGRTLTLDVTDTEAVERAVADAARDGALAGLVYAVGSIDLGPLSRITAESMERSWRLNALAPAMALKAGAKPLKKGRGAVVLFSSVAVAQGFPSHAVIASAKGAVEGLARSAAVELAPDARVNVIAPSLTRTRMAEPLLRNDTFAAAVKDMHPINRLGEAEDVAALADFLLSDRAGWITGQVVGVDGGRSSLRLRS